VVACHWFEALWNLQSGVVEAGNARAELTRR
jgi:hypothetical protein